MLWPTVPCRLHAPPIALEAIATGTSEAYAPFLSLSP
jgi:hypothetical protein